MKRLFTFLLALLMVSAVHAQQDDAPPISPALDAQLDRIEAAISRLRGLDAQDELIRLFPSREEARAEIIRLTEEQLTDEYVFEETQFYRAFDFFDETVDLRAVYLNLIGEQAAGFYNSETKEMTVVPISGETLTDSLPLLESITYAHEFTHALQDQYFDLAAVQAAMPENEPDQLIAVLSLIEGDATVAMTDYALVAVQENPQSAIELLSNPDILAAAEIPEGTPDILANELIFPYQIGQTFVEALRTQGGWDAVNAAYANLPQSSEQVIHPERYLAGDMPQDVTVTDALDALEGDGWQQVFERTLGEFYLRRYLITQLPQPIVNTAATGWGGDRYILYTNDAADERAWVMNLVWDTPEDATEFLEAFQQFGALRTNAEMTPKADNTIECWEDMTTGESLCLQSATMTIAFAPSLADAMALVMAQE